MKKIIFIIISIFFTLILASLWINFGINNFKPNNHSALTISEIFSNKNKFINKEVKIIGVPFCTQFGTKFFDYYYIYLLNPNNNVQGIYINFNYSVGKKNKILTKKNYYFYKNNLIMLKNKTKCINSFKSFELLKDKNTGFVVINGFLKKINKSKNLELILN